MRSRHPQRHAKIPRGRVFASYLFSASFDYATAGRLSWTASRPIRSRLSNRSKCHRAYRFRGQPSRANDHSASPHLQPRRRCLQRRNSPPDFQASGILSFLKTSSSVSKTPQSVLTPRSSSLKSKSAPDPPHPLRRHALHFRIGHSRPL